ncbi:MAG: D-alanine--D-alanine ligase [Candidatus Omnitrophota bacterium]|nr:MAG: D-alanine--D-alanine ligase [Candidatus Omnitrophota bacterium]
MKNFITSQGHNFTSLKNLGKIGVIMGGLSSERDISLKSGEAVYNNLKQAGIEVVAIDIETENSGENIRLLKDAKIDCAFLALHGRFGEDGQIQQILEDLNIAYTGSGVEASRLAMDKIASRQVFKSAGLNVPNYREIISLQADASENLENFNFPLVIKPVTHGSSIGLSIVDKAEHFKVCLREAFKFDKRVIIEEYIAGREITVGILDQEALPVIEIIPKKRFFDFEAKYSLGSTEYIVPAKLEREITTQIQMAGLSAHKSLGCYGCSRVDMILGKDNLPFILEVNTIPGLTETSLLPKAAKAKGVSFAELCIKLIQLAYEKT